ncbi:MAG: hypothetical protein IKG18_12910 [Atopobiaceae bacterium]|nr:hypothetical protein [Atopobiaceae bacterium]
MKLLGKRMASFALAGSLILTGLAGCGGSQPAQEEQTEATTEQTAATTEQEAQQEDSGPKTANELILLYKQSGATNNAHLDFSMDFDVTGAPTTDEYGYEEESESITVRSGANLDFVGDNAHGTLTATALDEEVQQEIYVTKEGTKYVTYTSSDNGQTWTKSESDQSAIPSQDLTMDTLLSQGEFAPTSTGYTLTVSGDKLMATLGNDLGLDNSVNNDPQLTQALQNSTAVYVFDKEYHLTEMTYNFAYKPAATAAANQTTSETEDTTQEQPSGVTMNMNLSMKFSSFGLIQETAVTVPQTVTSSATESTGDETSYDEYGNEVASDYSDYGYDDTDYSAYDDSSSYDDSTSYDSSTL